MNRYTLTSEAEAKAYADIAKVLEGLPVQSQYSVLRKVAHDMDREVVKPGAVRTAAARSATAVGAKLQNTQPKKSTNPKGLKAKSVDPLFERAKKDYFERPEVLSIARRREELKAQPDKTPEVLKEISEISLHLRDGLQLFLDSQGVQKPGKATPLPKGPSPKEEEKVASPSVQN